jgi:hypothetical protein
VVSDWHALCGISNSRNAARGKDHTDAIQDFCIRTAKAQKDTGWLEAAALLRWQRAVQRGALSHTLCAACRNTSGRGSNPLRTGCASRYLRFCPGVATREHELRLRNSLHVAVMSRSSASFWGFAAPSCDQRQQVNAEALQNYRQAQRRCHFAARAHKPPNQHHLRHDES